MTCPAAKELSEFALGKLDEPSVDAVARHLESCPHCQETVARIGSEDTFLTKVKQSGQVTDAAISEPAGGESSAASRQAGIIEACIQASRKNAMNVSAGVFIQNVESLEFASAAEVSTIVDGLPADKREDSQELARVLVQSNKLTRFQASLLLKGQGKSLMLGDYVVLDRIGAGGMGQVFRARHRRMDRIVALKVLARKALLRPDAAQRFSREVKAAARLIHPNIVTAFDAGEQDGSPYLVMELVDGPDLASVIKKQGAPPVKQVLELIQQAARGLAFAHSKGVVHRDIKPGNLLVGRDGMVKILDMGLARLDEVNDAAEKQASAELTQDGDVMGTIDYMAPEQVLNTRNADARADVYSLGCTFFRLLTGQSLYPGETVMERIVAHREQSPPSAHAIRAEVPPAVDTLIARMVAKRPEDRPTMAAVIEALDTLKRGAPLAMSQPIATAIPATANLGTSNLGTMEGAAAMIASSSQPPPRSRGGVLIAAAAAGFVLLALGVWIVVRDKDGNKIAEIQVPDGSTVTVQPTPTDDKQAKDKPAEDAKAVKNEPAPATAPATPMPVPLAQPAAPATLPSSTASTPTPVKVTPPTVVTLSPPATPAVVQPATVPALPAAANPEPFVVGPPLNIPNAIAPARTMPGILALEFPRLRSQDNGAGALPKLDEFYVPVGEPAVVPSIVQHKFTPTRNFMAIGWVKITQPGEYGFRAITGYDFNALYVDGKLVVQPSNNAAGQKVNLSAGFVPVVLVATPFCRGQVSLDWQSPGEANFTSIPGDRLFHDPAEVAIRRKQIADADAQLKKSLPPTTPHNIIGLRNGLRVQHYASLPSQPVSDKRAGGVDRSELVTPIAADTVETSLNPWKYNPDQNHVASGLLRIDRPGEYVFHCFGDWDREALSIAGQWIQKFREGDAKLGRITLQPGLIPIEIIGYASNDFVELKWQPPGERELIPVPSELFYHQPATTGPLAATSGVAATTTKPTTSAAPVDPTLVAQTIEVKKPPVGVAPGAITFAGPRGDGRSGANGVVIAAHESWPRAGTRWRFNYTRANTAHGVQLIHPLGNGHLRIILMTDRIDVFNNGVIGQRIYTERSTLPIAISPAASTMFPLTSDKQYAVESVLNPAGNYQLRLDGVAVVTTTITSIQPLRLSPPFDDPQAPQVLAVGQAGLIIGPMDGGVNRATDVHFELLTGIPRTAVRPTPPNVATTAPTRPTPSTTGSSILGTPSLNTPGGSATPEVTANRVKIPDSAAQKTALDLVKDIFKDEYAKTKPEEKMELAVKLIQQADQSRDDKTSRYVMLNEARDLAIDAGEPSVLDRAVSALGQEYEVDRTELMADGWEEMLRKPRPVAVTKAVAEMALANVDRAVSMANFESAARLSKLAIDAARKSKDAALVKSAVDRDKGLTAEKLQHEVVQNAAKVLKEKPDDAEANLTMGRYLCFTQEDWDAGLPLLIKSADPVFKELAEKTAAIPTDAAEQVELADAWYKAAEAAKSNVKTDLQIGARYWYSQAASSATGLIKVKVDQRLKQLGGLPTANKAAPTVAIATTANVPKTTTPSPSAPRPAVVPAAGDARQIAAYFLGLGGTVKARVSIQTTEFPLTNAAALPTDSFVVTDIRLTGLKNITDAQLAPLRGLTTVHTLYLNGMNITDAAFVNLQGMTGLETLNLSGSPQLGDRALLPIGQLTSLTSVTFNSMQISDAGLGQLRNLVNLETLNVVGTPLNGTGLAQLTGLKKLTALNIGNSRFGDPAMAHVRHFTSLKTIDAARTQLTDAGMVHFKDLKELTNVYIHETSTSDIGLGNLQGASKLQRIRVGSKVTDAGIAALQKIVPTCRVER